VVRNHWLTKPDREAAGFFDASIWEEAKKTGPLALKRLINGGLQNTSVTAILIGSQTYERQWVRYEIMRSMSKGNTILGVHINGIKDKFGRIKAAGPNPFDFLGYRYSNNGTSLDLYEVKNGTWVQYGDMDSYTLKTPVSREKWGQFYRLSATRRTYDWITHNGYNNFAQWVGD
jgi:hypothetical protein